MTTAVPHLIDMGPAAAIAARAEYYEREARASREAALRLQNDLEAAREALRQLAQRAAEGAHFSADARAQLILEDIAARALRAA